MANRRGMTTRRGVSIVTSRFGSVGAALRSEALRLLEQGREADTVGFLGPEPPPTERSSESGAHGEPNPDAAETNHVGKMSDRAPILRSQWPGGCVSGLRSRSGPPRRSAALPRSDRRGRGRPSPGSRQQPYVARCHGVERIDVEAYLVVEYVPGRNLAEDRRDGPLDLAEVVRILTQLAERVAAVHARGMIHR
jgi:serine/threonine protein kinase